MGLSDDDLRALLGLTEADALDELGSIEAPTPDQHYGKGATTIVALAALLAQSGVFSPTAAPEGFAGRLYQNASAPAVIAVEADDVTPLQGEWAFDDGDLVLDGRSQPAAARVRAGDREQVVVVDGLITRVFEVDRATAADPIASWQPPATDVGDPPAVSALLGEAGCPDWLRARTAELEASTWALDRVAAVGTLARLWTPSSREERARALAGNSPSRRAQAWAASLGGPQRDNIARLGLVEVGTLHRELDELEATAVAGQDTSALARDLVDRRDALESLRSLLATIGAGERLGAALQALDAHATAHLSAFPPLESPSTDWLVEVAWQEPDAWWAAPSSEV